MMNFPELASDRSDPLVPFTDQLRLAVAAYLARFKGSSREHTESDLRCYLTWCAERGLDPLAAPRSPTWSGIMWPKGEADLRSPTECRDECVSTLDDPGPVMRWLCLFGGAQPADGRRIRAANRSRRLTTPQTVRPSTTGRWRNPFRSMI
jgi:hypothetical protein